LKSQSRIEHKENGYSEISQVEILKDSLSDNTSVKSEIFSLKMIKTLKPHGSEENFFLNISWSTKKKSKFYQKQLSPPNLQDVPL
jgi:hypothetical protein